MMKLTRLVGSLLLVCIGAALAKEATLDVTFDREKIVKVGNEEVVLDGGTVTLESGQKAMAFGSKVFRFPAKGLVSESGTLVLDFALGKMERSESSARTLLMLRSGSRLLVGMSTYFNNPLLQFVFNDQTNKFVWATGKILKPGLIYQGALSWDGDKVRCYLDGQLVKEAKQPVGLDTGKLTTLNLGPHADSWYRVKPWKDDTLAHRLRVYDYALSPAEIQKLSGGSDVAGIHLRYPRTLTAPKRQGEIVADAKLDEEAWRNAAAPVSVISMRNPAETWNFPPHHAKYTWDEQNLYLAVDAVFPQGAVIRKGKGPNDAGGVWEDESFELYLRHGGNMYYFAGCVAGGMSVLKNHDNTYRPEWRYVSHSGVRIDDRLLWQGEVVVPWSAIELSGPPKELKMNLSRSWRSSAISASSDLANQREKGYWADEQHQFTLRFADSVPCLTLLRTNDLGFGSISQEFELYCSQDSDAELKIIQEHTEGLVKPQVVFIRKVSLKAGQPQRLEVEADFTSEKVNRVVYELTDCRDGQVVLRQDLPVVLKMEYLSVAPRFTAEHLIVQVRTAILEKKLKRALQGKARLVLSGPDGKEVVAVPLAEQQPQRLPFAHGNQAGLYRVELHDEEGTVLSGCSVDFPGFGEWSRLKFDSTRIIPPYRPMVTKDTADGLEVQPIGRSYQWHGSGLLPTRLVSRGHDLLRRPAQLCIGQDGASVTLHSRSVAPHRVEFSGEGE
ncbi:MAG: hypothetical protein IJJ33_06785, partial [Victivallales bacterium]|nr:hypothetical protein [Victivallales bacterium]